MKRIFFVLWIVFLLSAFLFACSGGGGEKHLDTHRHISGVAVETWTIYSDQGTIVQVRPAAIGGVAGTIFEGIVGIDGKYEVVIPERYNSVDGFIIRILSKFSGYYVYSYVENGASNNITVNINQYTDALVRQFYISGNGDNPHNITSSDKQIDLKFLSGLFSDGTAINLPDAITANLVMQTISRIIAKTYNFTSVQNPFYDSCNTGSVLNLLLQSSRFRNDYLYYEFMCIFLYPDFLIEGSAIQPNVYDAVDVEIWSEYGNTGTVIMRLRGIDYVMAKKADSINNNNHFTCQSDTGYQLDTGEAVWIIFSDDGIEGKFVITRQ
jgi:hypothetical protein